MASNMWRLDVVQSWNGGKPWTTTYEAYSQGVIEVAALEGLAGALMSAHQEVQNQAIILEAVSCREWQRNAGPYDPRRHFRYEFGLRGTQGGNFTNSESVEMVWKLIRLTGSGNPGYVNLRGVVEEEHVNKNQTGFPIILPEAPIAVGEVRIASFNAELQAFLNGTGSTPPICLAMIGSAKVGGTRENPVYGPPYVRLIKGFAVDEAAYRDMTRKSRDQRGVDPGDTTSGSGPVYQPGPPVVLGLPTGTVEV